MVLLAPGALSAGGNGYGNAGRRQIVSTLAGVGRGRLGRRRAARPPRGPGAPVRDFAYPMPPDSPAPPPATDGARLRRSLERLSGFGAHPDGGARRIAFSEDERAAREWLVGEMEAAGLAVRTDPAGNLFGRREGREPLPAILFGSHLDTVPRGGHFDGALGVLGALEVLRSLADQRIETRHPLEMAVWCDEEGAHFRNGLFGSRAATSGTPPGELDRTGEDGLSLHEWLEKYGEDPRALDRAVLDPRTVRAFFELHVEQGGTLERDGARLGVVEGIVGIHRFEARLTGSQNHAGTTPMAERRDAMLAAARLIAAVHEEIRRKPGGQVGNVGQFAVEPSAANVIPGVTRFPIELRDLDDAVVDDLIARIGARAERIAADTGCAAELTRTLREPPATMDPGLREVLRRLARDRGHEPVSLPSRAGHDAQNLARHGIPTAMIFVPSQGGISHAPEERTSWEDCALGAELLRDAVLAVDRA